MRLFIEKYLWILSGVLLFLTSCLPMGKISVQVPVPPKRALPDEIQSIVLMNRSMTGTFSNYDKDTLEAIFVKKKLKLDEIYLDSLASDTTLQTLGNALYESGRFDIVIPVRRNIPNSNFSFQSIPPSLTLPQVQQICNEFKTDALLTLDNFHEKVNTSYRVELSNYYLEGGKFNNVTAFIQVAYHSNWKLYRPGDKLTVAKFEVNDTIYWERSGPTMQETYEKLPLIKETLLDAAIENARNLSEYVTPGLREEERGYFLTKNYEADQAVLFLQKNEWNEAENIWMKFVNAGKPDFRSKIEFNLALASEMKGDPKGALEWAKKSYKSKYSKAAEDYVLLLSAHIVNN